MPQATPPPPARDDDPAAPDAILLAAGRGTRMSDEPEPLPKVLVEVAGQPMLHWVVRACREAGVRRCVIVIGYRGDLVRERFADVPGCVFVEQTQQLGTGHAARMAAPLFEGEGDRDVYVLGGDGPLIRSRTLRLLLDTHRRERAAATLATSVLDDPTGYGRVLRDSDGGFARIVEQKDATPAEVAVREVNPSYYCFRSGPLFEALGRVGSNNAQGEYYLTDVPGMLREAGETVAVVDAVPAEDVLSINTPAQRDAVERVLMARHLETADKCG